MRFSCVIGLLLWAVPVQAQLTGTATVKPRPALDRKAISGPTGFGTPLTSDGVGGPLIGYAARADGSGVYSLLGFPGAAFAGTRLTLARSAGAPVISSVGGYALARGSQSGELLVYGLRPKSGSGMLLPSAFHPNAQADRIVVSPLGRVALLYDRERREVEILAGFPGQPISLYTVSLVGVPGMPIALAVSDDGAVALAAFSSENGAGEIYSLQRDLPASRVAAVGRVVDLSFVPQTRDALAADYERNQVLILKDAGREGTQTLAGRGDGVRAPIAVEAATSGRVIVVNEGSGTLVVIPADQSSPSLFACGCAPTGLERLKNPNSFRLTTGAGVQAVLQTSQNQSDVFYIPASEEATEPSGSLAPKRTRQ